MHKVYPYTQIIGDVKIGQDVVIGAHCDIIDLEGGIIIGDRVRIQSFCFICSGVTIGDDTFIGPRVTFVHNNYPKTERKFWRKIIVGKNVMLGAGAIILPGVEIGDNAVIGAGSVVTRNVPAGVTVFGNPAKQMERIK